MTVARATTGHVAGKCNADLGVRYCGLRAGQGTDHVGIGRCKHHLGSTENHRRSAEKVKAARALDLLGVPVTTDPVRALQDALDGANGFKLAAERLITEATAGEEDVDWRQLNARLVMYGEQLDRLARVAKLYFDAGIAERELRLRDEQGAVLLELFIAYMTRMGYTPERMSEGRKVFAATFRELTPRLAGGS